MYTLAIQRDFIAQHFLFGADWGAENELHAHHYRIEVLLEGNRLDQHGYLVDIVALEESVEALVARYKNQILNEQPAFAGLNPSIEHFSRILCQAIDQDLVADNICAVTLKVWENEIAWAAFRQERPCE
jgi:6-pyruvoyltetrahydropterin/6-carboxytetrahydropterin synthase